MKRSLVDRARDRLERGTWPRVHCSLIVALSSAAAFLASFAMLRSGVDSMAVRYAVAALAGYAAFLALIGAWVRWKWSRVNVDADPGVLDLSSGPDLPSFGSLPRGSGPRLFAGGRSGGGGASGAWGAATSAPPAPAKSGGGFSLDFDADDLIWVIVALVAAFAGLAAVGYVIYVAPTLLAEAAVDAAVAGRVYRGLRRRDSAHWTTHVVRRTAVSAAVVVLSALVAGYALQRIAPEARSIGGVWAHLQSR